MKDVLGVILGGGRGTRLYPLTKYRAKPAVSLAGKYRLIDIPVSNCLNSGIKKIAILTQFNSESLNKHVYRAYRFDFFSGGFVDIIAAEQSMDALDWFQGTADAVRKCFKHFNNPRIKYILILPGDQLCKINFVDLMNFHIKKKSEITIACNPVSKTKVSDLGIMEIDKQLRIKHFVEKPKKSENISRMSVMIDARSKFLASMGIYLFNKEILFELLSSSSKVDFGKEIIPGAISNKKTYAYIHKGYWKDIGSVESLYEESLAFTNPSPPIDLFDENWQFFTRPRYLPLSKIKNSYIENSNIAEGTILNEAKIIHSIVGPRTKVCSGAIIEDSIIMGSDYYENAFGDTEKKNSKKFPRLGIGRDCHIRKVIVDKNVRIGDGVKIINKAKIYGGFENEYCVINNGIIIIPKNTVIPSGTVI